ncbi:DUF1289 domain-containing protein [Stagnimonas aquatica]|uniref:DUF1289 domain-containing protein n=1 Tax=Stagnimonas aquatica TaxID=2689987 RepID=A0A3N0VEV0_9GAMM|nr:DUF1289 domain-containing protein [Stagnimonas aquatica]
MPPEPPASPCVGVCQLQGRLCIGCGREIGEIAEWGSASPGRKNQIVAAARQRLAIIQPSTNRSISS